MSNISMVNGHDDAVVQGELISRSALLAEYCDGCPGKFNDTCSPNDPICGLAQLIYEAPAVDAVPVVRCNDCVHCVLTDEVFHTRICTTYGCDISADDFCSYGKRRDGDGT